jgi:hypothetical protein
MSYIVTEQEKNPIVPISELPNGTLAIAINGGFKGELFYKNVAGIIGISVDRYWASAYMEKTTRAYVPNFYVRAVTEKHNDHTSGGSMSIHNGQDIIDSRDVIARIEELQDDREAYQDASNTAAEALKNVAPEDANEDHMFELQDEADGTLDELNNWDQVNGEELKALRALDSEGRDATSEWSHGEALIRDSYFEDYAMQLADDIGAIDRNAEWPVNCIDWKQAAEQLQQDYSSVNFEGEDYWIRSA